MPDLMRDLARAFDPVVLARDCGIEPDAWQAQLMRDQPRRALLCCSRQSGKSTTCALIGLWTAIYRGPSLILLVSPSQRQSSELFRSLMLLYAKLDGAPPLTNESVQRAELSNGSRIISLPGSEKTTRGYSKADVVIIDEASRTEDDLIAALRPTMAVSEGGGRLIALSTPAGKRGWFYEAWESGGEEWTRVSIPASACPRISKEFLEGEMKALGPMKYSEEYELAWLEPDEAVFDSALIDACFTTEVRPIWT